MSKKKEDITLYDLCSKSYLDNALYATIDSLIRLHKENRDTIPRSEVIDSIINNVKGHEVLMLRLGLKDIEVDEE